MTLYTVKFRTGVSFAMIDIEAETPDVALAAAHLILETELDDLVFEDHDLGRFSVNEIAIENEEGDEVALWLDPERREMLCASELADALQNIVRVLRAPPSSEGIRAALHEADAALAKARPPAPEDQAGIPAETAPLSAA